jgi:hypothetical protein
MTDARHARFLPVAVRRRADGQKVPNGTTICTLARRRGPQASQPFRGRVWVQAHGGVPRAQYQPPVASIATSAAGAAGVACLSRGLRTEVADLLGSDTERSDAAFRRVFEPCTKILGELGVALQDEFD